MINFFYSDPHFGHTKIIEYCARPFSSVQEMNAELVRRYNERVSKEDVVLWAGDCFLGSVEFAQETMGKLNGTKLLVRGNHDGSAARMARTGFAVVSDGMTLSIGGHVARVEHRPRRTSGGEYLIHGHVHAMWRRQGSNIHIGVDAWNFAPVSLAEVLELIETEADVELAGG